jgi:hypothetical protein
MPGGTTVCPNALEAMAAKAAAAPGRNFLHMIETAAV